MTPEPRAAARSQLIRMLADAIVRDLMEAPRAKPEDDDADEQQPANRPTRRALRAVQQRQPAPHVDR